MKLTISVNLDNAVFRDEEADGFNLEEVEDILEQAAGKAESILLAEYSAPSKRNLLDSNGNTVGHVELSDF